MVTTGDTGRIHGPDCPTRRTLELVADKWTPLIICVLSDGTVRYSELQRRCVDISRKMLSQTLRRMERDGLVLRAVFPEVPPRTEYSLTDLGESLIEPLTGLCAWGAVHLPRIDAARQAAAARREQAEKVLETVP